MYEGYKITWLTVTRKCTLHTNACDVYIVEEGNYIYVYITLSSHLFFSNSLLLCGMIDLF